LIGNRTRNAGSLSTGSEWQEQKEANDVKKSHDARSYKVLVPQERLFGGFISSKLKFTLVLTFENWHLYGKETFDLCHP